MKSKTTLQIDGMHCDACVRRVRSALSNLEGVHVNNVAVGSAEIEIDPARVDRGAIIHALDDIGFTAKVS